MELDESGTTESGRAVGGLYSAILVEFGQIGER